MTVPIVAFFNSTGGVGKTSLVYHLAWMYSDLGHTVVAVDLDPSSNLTAAFLEEVEIEALWGDELERSTIYDAIGPVMRGEGPPQIPARVGVSSRLNIVAGHPALSSYESELALEWDHCLLGRPRAFHVTTALWQSIQQVAREASAEVALVDLGSNLGALNRAALVASDYVVIPVAPDLFSLHGLRTLGSTLRGWRAGWNERIAKNPDSKLPLPAGSMTPAGYIVLQHVLRMDRPTRAADRWMARIPSVYADSILGQPTTASSPHADPQCLGMVKRYGSLMPLSQEARKPVFHLKASDGAVGSHAKAVLDARHDFEALARKVAAASWQRAE